MQPDFNFVAQVQLQAPANVGDIRRDIEKALQGITAEINMKARGGARASSPFDAVSTGARQVQRAMADVNASSVTAVRGLATVQRASSDLTRVLSAQERQIRSSANALEGFGYQSGLAARRFLAFATSAGVAIRLTSEIRKATQASIDFNQQMVRLRQVSGNTPRQIQEVASEVDRLSTSLGVASKGLSQTAVTLTQAGYSLRDVKTLLDDLATSELAPNFEGLEQTTEGVIAIMSQFETPANRMREQLGSINAVAGSFAVEAGDLITVVRQTGGAFKQTGGDLNELLSLFTAVRATTRESAETIGTGLRTIFTRLQRKETVDSLRDLGINLRYTRQEAEALGNVNLQDQFVGTYEAIQRISEGLANLRSTDPRYASIQEELGGYRQISRVVPLLQQFGTAQKALNVARSGQVSLDIAQEQAQDALANKIAKVEENFLSLFRTLTEDRSIQQYIGNILDLTNGIINLTESIAPVLPYFAMLGAFKIAPSLVGMAGNFSRGAFRTGNRFASGGLVPGSGSTDSVPAILPPGSFVLRRDAVNAIGSNNLKKIDDAAERGVDSLLTPGEYVFGPRAASKLGSMLPYMNHAEKFARGGKVQRFADGGSVGRRVTGTFSGFAENEAITASSWKSFNAAVNDAVRGLDILSKVLDGTVKVVAELSPVGKSGKSVSASFLHLEGQEGRSVTQTGNKRTNVNRYVSDEDGGTMFASSPRTPEQIRADLMQELGREGQEINPDKFFKDLEKFYKEDVKSGQVRTPRGTSVVGGVVGPIGEEDISPSSPVVNQEAINKTKETIKKAVSESVQAAMDQVGRETAAPRTRSSLRDFVRRRTRGEAPSAEEVGGVSRPESRALVPSGPGTAMVLFSANRLQTQTGDYDPSGGGPGGLVPSGGRSLASRRGPLVPREGRDLALPESGLSTDVRGTVIESWVLPARERGPLLEDGRGGGGNSQPPYSSVFRPPPSSVRAPRTTSLDNIIKERLDTDLTASFGSDKDKISEQTRNQFRDRVLDQVNREFVDAQTRLIQGIYKNIDADEARRIAVEEATKANEKIARGESSGVVVRQDEFISADGSVRAGGIVGENRTVMSAEKAGIGLGGPYNQPQPLRRDISEVIEGRAKASLRGQFGDNADSVSQQTRVAATMRAEAAVRDEFIEAEKRAILAINKNLDAEEAKRIASERYAGAMERQAKGLDSGLNVAERGGRIVGSAEVAGSAQRTGTRLPGATGFGFRFSQGLSSARDSFGLANDRFSRSTVGRGLNSAFGGPGSIALAIGAPIAAQGLSGLAGNADQAARGNASGFRAAQGTGGALQSGVLGATLGFSVGGPMGAAVGGVVGGLTGLVYSLKDAETQIRNVKISDAIEGFSSNLGKLGGGNSSAVVTNAIREELIAYQGTSRDKAISELGGWFSSPNFSEMREVEQRAIRVDLGGRLPEFSQLVSDSGQSLARENPEKSVEELVIALRQGNNGLNETFIDLIAKIRQIPVAEVLGEITKDLRNFKSSLEVAAKVRESEDVNVTASNSLTRLVQAIDLASRSFDSLQSGLQTRNTFFSGGIQTGGVNFDRLSQNSFGGPGGQAATLFGQLSGFGGGGDQFTRSATAADEVAKVLPGALAEAIRVGGADTESMTTQLESLLRDVLKVDGNTSAEMRAVINSVVGGAASTVDKSGSGEFSRSVERDSVAVAQELLSSITDPLIQAGNEASGLLSNALNGYLSNVGQGLQQRSTIDSNRNRVDELSLERSLSMADLGRNRQGVSLRELENPFRSSLNRLTGGGPADAAGISSSLRQNLRDQQTERQKADDESLGIKAQTEAGEKLRELQFQAGNLTGALQKLSDVSSRSAGIREKLNQLEEERSGRFNLAERAVLGGASEQLQLQRGLSLVSRLDDKSDLGEFSSSDRNLIASTLKTLGGAEIGTKGRADELYRSLIENTVGFATLSGPKATEQQGLEKQLDGYFAEAMKASTQLADIQQAEHQTFLAELKQVFSTVEKSIQGAFMDNAISATQNRLSASQIQLGKVEEQERAKGRLAAVGVDGGNIEGFTDKKTQGELASLLDLRSETERLSESFKPSEAKAAEIFTKIAPEGIINRPVDPKTGDTLQSFSDKDIRSIQDAIEKAGINKDVASEFGAGLLGPYLKGEDIDQNNFTRQLQKAGERVSKREGSPIQESEHKLQEARAAVQTRGFDPEAFESRYQTEESRKQLATDMEQFQSPEAFTELPEVLEKAAEAVEKLKKELEGLQNPVALSQGGSIFQPIGTDTVPAMLTPNEYVINARSAMANFGLLEQINRAKGPVYLADGGPADTNALPWWRRHGLLGLDKEGSLGFDGLSSLSDYFGKPSAGVRGGLGRFGELLTGKGYGGGGGHNTSTSGWQTYLPKKLQRDINRNIAGANKSGMLESILGAASGAASGGLFGAVVGGAAGQIQKNRSRPTRSSQQDGHGSDRDILFLRQLRANSLFPQDMVDESLASRQDFLHRRALGFSKGGVVPGAGTGDTVPAMLEPGEHVLSRHSVNRLGGHGAVQYLANGGLAGEHPSPLQSMIHNNGVRQSDSSRAGLEYSRSQESGQDRASQVQKQAAQIQDGAANKQLQAAEKNYAAWEKCEQTVNKVIPILQEHTKALGSVPHRLEHTGNINHTHDGPMNRDLGDTVKKYTNDEIDRRTPGLLRQAEENTRRMSP